MASNLAVLPGPTPDREASGSRGESAGMLDISLFTWARPFVRERGVCIVLCPAKCGMLYFVVVGVVLTLRLFD